MDAEIEVDSAEDPNIPSLTHEVGQNGAVHLHVQPGILPPALYIYNVCYYYSAASFASQCFSRIMMCIMKSKSTGLCDLMD